MGVINAGDSAADATTVLGKVSHISDPFVGGALVNILWHNFDVSGKPTTDDFKTYVDSVVALRDAGKLIPITPHDLVRGLGKIN